MHGRGQAERIVSIVPAVRRNAVDQRADSARQAHAPRIRDVDVVVLGADNRKPPAGAAIHGLEKRLVDGLLALWSINMQCPMMMPAMAKIEVIDNESALRQLSAQWNELSAAATPMQSPAWMLAWWDAYRAPQNRLYVLAARGDDGKLIGLVPWYQQTSLTLGTTLRFLGSGRACSDFQTILCNSADQTSVVASVVDWLSQVNRVPATSTAHKSQRWDLLDLEGVSSGDAVMQSFIDGMAARGHVTHRRPTENTWRLDVSGGWQGYLSRQSKTQRSQARNFINRFEKNAELTMRFSSEQPQHAEPMITALIELHQRRWQAVGQPGCFADPRMSAFFENAIREMLAQGQAEITLLERNGQPVAGHVWLTQSDALYMYQSGREPQEEPNRVGTIANALVIRWASENGFQMIDFLRGDEPYKAKLRAEPTLSHRVRVVARANFSELRHKVWLACRGLKSRLQELRKPNTNPPVNKEAAEEVVS